MKHLLKLLDLTTEEIIDILNLCFPTVWLAEQRSRHEDS